MVLENKYREWLIRLRVEVIMFSFWISFLRNLNVPSDV